MIDSEKLSNLQICLVSFFRINIYNNTTTTNYDVIATSKICKGMSEKQILLHIFINATASQRTIFNFTSRHNYNITMTKQKGQKGFTSNNSDEAPSQNRNKNSQTKFITKSRLKEEIESKLRSKVSSRLNYDLKTSKKSQQNISKAKLVVGLIGRDQLECPICLEYCIYPVLTQCGHYYCLVCFQSTHKKSQLCCVCRGNIDVNEYQPSMYLQNLFDQFVEKNFDISQSDQYKIRVKKLSQCEQKRKIPEVPLIGSKIDYKFKGLWVEAQITSITKYDLAIKFTDESKNRLKKATTNKKSRLLAAHKYFTSFPSTIQPTNTIVNNQVPILQDDRDWQNLIQLSDIRDNRWFTEEIEAQNRRDWALLRNND